MAKSPSKTASVLAFDRKLFPSDGIMYGCRWNKRSERRSWNPIPVESKHVRGTISNRQKNAKQNDPAKLDAEIQKPNLQRVDVASLSFDDDTLVLSFTLRIDGNVPSPSACNDQDYQEKLKKTIEGYISTQDLYTLAARYATNLVNGRPLWRNRIGAEAIEVRIKQILDNEEKSNWVFDAKNFGLRAFPEPLGDLQQVAEIIRNGLRSNAFSFFQVEIFARVGSGQEVFPSQELVPDSKEKVLYRVKGVAAMHSQKIGNALRTIDTWYPDAQEMGPIAVEPYGSVTSRGKAYRQPKDKIDFYSLLDGWVLKDKVPAIEQQHYVIATLIRGGVFGESDK